MFFIILLLVLAPTMVDPQQTQENRIIINGDITISSTLQTNDFSSKNFDCLEKIENKKIVKINKAMFDGSYIEHLHTQEIAAIDSELNISGDLYLASYDFETIEAKSFIAQDVKQWQLERHDDFDTNATLEGWDFNLTSSCDEMHTNFFLGGNCKLSSDEVSKSYSNLSAHESVKITANIHYFDDWQGEVVYMKVNDQIVWQKAAKSSSNKGAFNVCGNRLSDPSYGRSVHVDLPHSKDWLKISFGSNLKKEACQASFGVDDVMIYTK